MVESVTSGRASVASVGFDRGGHRAGRGSFAHRPVRRNSRNWLTGRKESFKTLPVAGPPEARRHGRRPGVALATAFTASTAGRLLALLRACPGLGRSRPHQGLGLG